VSRVNVELDHVFILCSVGAPEADALARIGLREGTPNDHPGQGTACRRFFFENAYLELLWVSDAREAQGESARGIGLGERWSLRAESACPFGVVLRPAADTTDLEPGFPTWPYRPRYLPDGMWIDVARGTGMQEPAIFYLRFQRGRPRRGKEPESHAIPTSRLRRLTISGPRPQSRSEAAAYLERAEIVGYRDADDHAMELGFEGIGRETADLRPTLPLVLQW
jgi:hypothetical protein